MDVDAAIIALHGLIIYGAAASMKAFLASPFDKFYPDPNKKIAPQKP